MKSTDFELFSLCRDFCELSYIPFEDFRLPFGLGELLEYKTEQKIFIPPFFVVKDSSRIFVAIRGTKTLDDYLTDAFGFPVDFFGYLVHAGFLTAGKYVYDNMKTLIDTNKDTTEVVFTGHSMGGAAAAIASILFSIEYKNIPVRCVTFGCPGLISVDTNALCTNFIDSFVMLGDVIPFASGHNMITKSMSAVNFSLALTLIDNEPKLVPIDYIEQKPKEPTESVFPLLIPPGRIWMLGSKDTKRSEAAITLLKDPIYFSFCPIGQSISNHSIGFYGKTLSMVKDFFGEKRISYFPFTNYCNVY